jgi:hypothetical protein
MQTAFGDGELDLPCLSYVCGVAELTLRMILGSGGQSQLDVHTSKLFKVLNGTVPHETDWLHEEEDDDDEDGDEEEEGRGGGRRASRNRPQLEEDDDDDDDDDGGGDV